MRMMPEAAGRCELLSDPIQLQAKGNNGRTMHRYHKLSAHCPPASQQETRRAGRVRAAKGARHSFLLVARAATLAADSDIIVAVIIPSPE